MTDSMKPVRHFSDEYLEHCRCMSPEEILAFLESYRKLQGDQPGKSKKASLRVPEDLLGVFEQKSKAHGLPYQTLIKQLMREWIDSQP